jgi:hypothetical protein
MAPTLWISHSLVTAYLQRQSYFKRDAMFAWELVYSTSDGDVGRMWECIKVCHNLHLNYIIALSTSQAMLFTFARSSHTNYTSYTLEMICDLEYESPPELKEASVLSLVVNPTGEEGGFVAGNIYQEGLNRGIKPIVQKKDANFGAYHIRHLWSCNIKDIQDL